MKRKLVLKQGQTSLFVLIILIISLVSLAGIQLSLNENASTAQSRTIKQNLRAAGFNFINDFNRELAIFRDILNQYLGDRVRDSKFDSIEGAHVDAVNASYKFYQENTKYPKLIKEIYLLKNRQAQRSVTYQDSIDDRMIFVDEDGDDLAGVKNYEVWKVQSDTVKISDKATIDAIVKNSSQNFLMDENSITANYMVFLTPGSKLQIIFDLNEIRNTLLRTLSERYFSTEGVLKDFVLKINEADSKNPVFKNRDLDVSNFESELTIPLLANRRTFTAGSQFERIPNVEFWLGDQNALPREVRIEAKRTGVLSLSVFHSMGNLDLALSHTKTYNTIFSIGLLLILLTGLLYLYLLFNRHRLMIQTQHNFISSVSHEIKTPISVLKAAAENLKEGIVKDPDATVRYGERMLVESDRLLNLTENVLRYAKLDSMQGLDSSIFQDIDLSQLLKARIEYWELEFSIQHALIEYTLSEEQYLVSGDLGALQALIDNLLSNALKHGVSGSEDKRVVLSLSGKSAIDTKFDSGARVIFSIKDFGSGISKKYQKLIFEPFYRPPRTRANGIGLGLSLVKKIAAAHEGRVIVQSSTLSGTLFEVHLPRITQ